LPVTTQVYVNDKLKNEDFTVLPDQIPGKDVSHVADDEIPFESQRDIKSSNGGHLKDTGDQKGGSYREPFDVYQKYNMSEDSRQGLMNGHNNIRGLDDTEFDILNIENIFPYEMNINYWPTRDCQENLKVASDSSHKKIFDTGHLTTNEKALYVKSAKVKAEKVLRFPGAAFYRPNT
jgi:hypothetical protein